MYKSKIYKYYFIYKTTCIITDKYYYGMHSTNNLNDVYIGSGIILRRSLKKYGKHNHIFEIIEFCSNLKELLIKEFELIDDKQVKNKKCMNLMRGGLTDKDHLLKWSSAGNAGYRRKMADPEFRLAMKLSSSIRLKQLHAEGKVFTRGSRHTEITKQKMSSLKKGIYNGNKNPAFNTCWINKDFINCSFINSNE